MLLSEVVCSPVTPWHLNLVLPALWKLLFELNRDRDIPLPDLFCKVAFLVDIYSAECLKVSGLILS